MRVSYFAGEILGFLGKVGQMVDLAKKRQNFSLFRFILFQAPTSWHPPPGNNLQASTSRHQHPGIHLQASTSWHPSPGIHLLASTSWHPPPGIHILASSSWHPPPGIHLLALLSCSLMASCFADNCGHLRTNNPRWLYRHLCYCSSYMGSIGRSKFSALRSGGAFPTE